MSTRTRPESEPPRRGTMNAQAAPARAAADELGDRVTADVLAEIARETEAQLWRVEAHLREEA